MVNMGFAYWIYTLVWARLCTGFRWWLQSAFRVVLYWFKPAFLPVLDWSPGWSAAGWPAGAPGCVGSVPVPCSGVLVSAAGHMKPGPCTAAESPLRTQTEPVTTSETSLDCV